MTRKRAAGEGSVQQRKDGRWQASLWSTDQDGTRRRHYFIARTRPEVVDKLDDARQRAEEGSPVKDAKVTIAALVEDWIAKALAASDRAPTTKENYATIARAHLKPAPFGAITLERLRASDIEALLVAKRASKSASTTRLIYTVLRACLDIAVRDGLVRRNVALVVKRPRLDPHDAVYFEQPQIEAMLAAAQENRLLPLLVFLVGTGVRRGEALALYWADVNLDEGTARIRFNLSRYGGSLHRDPTTKTRKNRTVPLPRQVVAALKTHRVAQMAERLRAGTSWRDEGFVFANEIGGAWEPRGVARRFAAVARAAELPGSLHTIRHSTASLLIRGNLNMKVVQELLGHSSYAITADIYAHISAGQTREAADQLEGALAW